MLEDAILMRLLRSEPNRFKSAARNSHHLSGFHFAHVFRIDQIERATFRCGYPGSVESSESKRTKPARVANRINLIARQQKQRISAFHLIQRVCDCSGKVS